MLSARPKGGPLRGTARALFPGCRGPARPDVEGLKGGRQERSKFVESNRALSRRGIFQLQLQASAMTYENTILEKALEHRARRAARREGLVSRRSRSTGGFMLVDPASNIPAAGFEYDLSAEGVIDCCCPAKA